jgi:hypothetical protein
MIYIAASLAAVFFVVYRVATIYYRRRVVLPAEPLAGPAPAEADYDLDRAECLLAGYRLDGTINPETYSYCMTKLAAADEELNPLRIPTAWNG